MEKNNEEKENFRSWLIAFGVFIINLLVLCPYRLSGLVYVVLIETYETDRKLAAMPIIVFILMTSILGPPVGLLGQRLGAEKTTLLGIILAALGFSGVYFAENITVVIIFLGFIYGAGLATGSFFLPNIVKKYFTKNLNTANGIVKSGSCVGALIFPPISIYLLDTYGTAGTFLIVAGIMLNGLPIGLLIMMASKDAETLHKPSEILLQEKTEINKPPESKVKNKIKDDISRKDLFATLKETRTDCPMESTYVLTMEKSTEDHSSDEEQSNENVLQFEKCNNSKTNSTATSSKNAIQSVSVKNTDASNAKVDEDNNETQSNDLEQKSNYVSYNSVSIKSTSKTKRHTFWSSLKVFMNPIFLVLVTIMSLLSYILTIVWTTLIDYSRDKGVPRKYEVYLLMFPPLFDLVGRVCLLWIVDKGFVGYTMFQMMTSLICAISVLGLILSSSFVMLMTYASIFALSTGAQIAIAPGLIFKFLEKGEHMMTMASKYIMYAPLSFTAVPLIGYFRNELKSYDGVYYVVIALCLISCAITPLANVFSIAKKRRKMKALEMDIAA